MAESYTSNVCRHIVWAIVCDGRYFFSKVKLCRDLKNGVWDDPPKSLLELSIDKVIYANIIERPNYPKEWTEQVRQPAQPQTQGARGALPTATQPQQANQQNASTGSGQRTPYVHPRESRHGLIKALVDPVIAKFGAKFAVKKILEANNVTYDQLPTIQKCIGRSGRSFLCWNHVLKGCTYHSCSFRNMGGHPDLKDFPGSFAASVCSLLQPGVDHLMSQEVPAHESQKRKSDDMTPPAPAE